MIGLAFLQNLATNAPEQLFRYAMDFDRQKGSDLGVTAWEKSDPGSLAAVLNAFGMTLNWIRQQKKLTSVDGLKSIHAVCAAHLPPHTRQGKFRITRVKFLILRQNITAEEQSYFSYLESLSVSEKRNQKSAEVKITTDGQLKYYPSMANLDNEKIDLLMTTHAQIDKTHKRDDIKNSSLAIWITLYDLYLDLLSLEHESTVKKYYEAIEVLHHFFKIEIRDILSTLDRQLSLPLSSRQKLYQIALAVQNLERLHPFRDVNCRTFCMVFLNTLLIQNNFLPALITDINKFDGYDLDSLVNLIEEGIGRSNVLHDYIQSDIETAAEQPSWCVIPDLLKPILSPIVSSLQKTILSPDAGEKEADSSSDDLELSRERVCLDELMEKINEQCPGLGLSIDSPDSLPLLHKFLMELKKYYLDEGIIQTKEISLAYIRLQNNYPEYMKNFSNVNVFVKFIQNGINQYKKNNKTLPFIC